MLFLCLLVGCLLFLLVFDVIFMFVGWLFAFFCWFLMLFLCLLVGCLLFCWFLMFFLCLLVGCLLFGVGF